jgi:two-component system chemotaxis response regulator CheB
MSAVRGPGRPIDAVVIGASAGGMEGLSVILPALPVGLPAALLIVLHLPREHRSLLSEIFAPKCALPVREAEDKEPVRAGCIYFAPPDYHLLIDEGPRLALSVDEPVHFSRPSIDVLFESAAQLYGERLLGVLLTGASPDGADGLAAVHEAGGVTVVQRPDGGHQSQMARAALARGPVDHMFSIDEIGAFLASIAARA